MVTQDRRAWRFYGRTHERSQIAEVLGSSRFFFYAISGRRRIGKTTLIREALRDLGPVRAIYVQIPDSDERGVVQSFRDAVDDNEVLPFIIEGTGRRRLKTLSDIHDF